MRDFKQYIIEGVYDPNIFKAFFLAGGPGSGKSWVSERALSGMGLKVINSDNMFANALKKERMSLDFSQYDPKEIERRDEIRAKAKARTGVQLKMALEGRLGLILDSTARDVSRIQSEANTMKHIGYDTFMVFVNTSLEVALKRNQMRARKLPDAIVITNHKQVQKNIGLLQRIFGASNFVIVDNNKVAEDVNPSVHKAIRRMVNRKPTSYQAVSWIKREIAKKKKKIKMGKLLQFPVDRVKRPVPEIEITDEQKQHLKEEQFIEQLTEQLSMDILSVLQENVIDVKSDLFLKDLGITIESIKSLLRRDFGKPHPMQPITDTLIRIITLPDGKKVSDINYGKIVKYTHTKPKPQPKEEKTVEIDFDFELE